MVLGESLPGDAHQSSSPQSDQEGIERIYQGKMDDVKALVFIAYTPQQTAKKERNLNIWMSLKIPDVKGSIPEIGEIVTKYGVTQERVRAIGDSIDYYIRIKGEKDNEFKADFEESLLELKGVRDLYQG
jgi:hypothetical protein